MKQPYAVFAEDRGEVKLLFQTSVRFSRANRAALDVATTYPGVFFAHFVGDKPVGERHKPSRPDLVRMGLIKNDWNDQRKAYTEGLREIQKRNREQLVADASEIVRRVARRLSTEKMTRRPK